MLVFLTSISGGDGEYVVWCEYVCVCVCVLRSKCILDLDCHGKSLLFLDAEGKSLKEQ